MNQARIPETVLDPALRDRLLPMAAMDQAPEPE
jgi:hypothetical protein